MASFTATWDSRQQDAYMRKFTKAEVTKILTKSNLAGANAAKRVLVVAAPTGRSKRPSQFYRREGLGHGTFRSSVRAAKIRARGIQANTVGHVVGPMGKKGFTRHWREGGTRPHGRHPGSRGTHWVARNASRALDAAKVASERMLIEYAQGLR